MSARRLARTALLGGALAMAVAATAPADVAAGPLEDVLVVPATTTQAVQADVERLGGEVVTVHDAVGMLVGRVPANLLDTLAADPDVRAVMPDTAVTFANEQDDEDRAETPGIPAELAGATIGADQFAAKGMTGAGIDICLVDTGVANDLDALDGSVVDGIDLSFDAGNPEFANGDGYGHGTHLAGLMVGDADGLQGIAPGARVIDVKTGDRHGAADVSQVIAALDWCIQNRTTDGRNIRVVNLAFGVPVAQDLTVDPLAYAAEAAWRNGLVVVASAGNEGAGPGQLANPAAHPIVLAVGASDTMGTSRRRDDVMTTFSQHGTADRGPDLAVPGRSLLSIVPEDSLIATSFPEAWRDDLFVGSGTSQASAVLSGAVAQLLQARPELTPDQVKVALTRTAMNIEKGTAVDGHGLPYLLAAAGVDVSDVTGPATALTSDGSGSLEAARAGRHVELVMDDGSIVTLEGEVDFTGAKWTGEAWAGSNWNGSNWNGSNWNGSNWNGSNWNGSNWNGSNWNGSNWNGSNWNGSNWNSVLWGE